MPQSSLQDQVEPETSPEITLLLSVSPSLSCFPHFLCWFFSWGHFLDESLVHESPSQVPLPGDSRSTKGAFWGLMQNGGGDLGLH